MGCMCKNSKESDMNQKKNAQSRKKFIERGFMGTIKSFKQKLNDYRNQATFQNLNINATNESTSSDVNIELSVNDSNSSSSSVATIGESNVNPVSISQQSAFKLFLSIGLVIIIGFIIGFIVAASYARCCVPVLS